MCVSKSSDKTPVILLLIFTSSHEHELIHHVAKKKIPYMTDGTR